MKKKYFIVLALALLLWGGFMMYRHSRKGKEAQLYDEKSYSQLIAAAKQSPKAGLAQVGMALQKYRKDTGSYPSSLQALYPKYLPGKALIDEIQWQYQPRGDDFYLSKAVIMGDKRIVASIDKGLAPRTETGIMVAARPKLPTQAPGEKAQEIPSAKTEPQSILAARREAFVKALKEGRMEVTSVYQPRDAEMRLIWMAHGPLLSAAEGMDVSEAESALAQAYLVWKSANGVLGFGNVQYPREDRFAMYALGQWYNVRPRPSEKGQSAAPIRREPRTVEPDDLAARLSGRHLVWREENGTLGFGNGAYPQSPSLAAFEADHWIARADPTAAPIKHPGQESQDRIQEKSPDSLASELSAKYLVWKDANGALGFGNLTYPKTKALQVFDADAWVAMVQPKAITPTEDPGRGSQEHKQTKSGDPLADLSAQCLVWKDAKGTLGFGNLAYPETRAVQVLDADKWVPNAGQAPAATATTRRSPLDQHRHKPADVVASELSPLYLVWKDTNGTLGFGNVQYPAGREISHMSDGTWQPLTRNAR